MAQLDESRGNSIVAIFEESGDPGLEKKFGKDAAKELYELAIPRRFIFLDKIPMLPVGKPDLQTLQKLLGHMM